MLRCQMSITHFTFAFRYYMPARLQNGRPPPGEFSSWQPKLTIFPKKSGNLQPRSWQLKKKQTGISGENHDVFITLTKWFLVQGSTQHCQSKTESWYQGGKEETSAELERDLNSKSTEDMRQEIQNITMLLDELNTF